MSHFNRLIEWLRDRVAPQTDLLHTRGPLPPIAFADIRAVDKPPRNEDILEDALYFVSFKRRPKWVLFQCPCGCKSIVTISLQRVHRPHWVLKNSRSRRPTLQPSVWRDVGCLSHFWINDGRVFWCQDTGTSPRMRSRPS